MKIVKYEMPVNIILTLIFSDNEPCCMYYVNDGVYGSFNCLIFDHAEVQPVPLIVSEL